MNVEKLKAEEVLYLPKDKNVAAWIVSKMLYPGCFVRYKTARKINSFAQVRSVADIDTNSRYISIPHAVLSIMYVDEEHGLMTNRNDYPRGYRVDSIIWLFLEGKWVKIEEETDKNPCNADPELVTEVKNTIKKIRAKKGL